MNKIPIIRKGSYKDYLNNSIGGGFILGLLFFLISLPTNSVINSMWIGLSLWVGVIILFIGVGFTSEEYFKRKQKIKKLYSDKYAFLDKNAFVLHQDLYFEGIYKDYHFRVLPMTEWQERKKDIEYVIIEAFYTFDKGQIDSEKEKNLSGNYFLGQLHFANHCVGFVPKDWELPNFKENFDGLIGILKREKLMPFSRLEWEEIFGKKLKEEEIKEEKSRTKQILKIGKLDLKYVKPKNKVSR